MPDPIPPDCPTANCELCGHLIVYPPDTKVPETPICVNH